MPACAAMGSSTSRVATVINSLCVPCNERLSESWMREIRTSGSTRGRGAERCMVCRPFATPPERADTSEACALNILCLSLYSTGELVFEAPEGH